MTRHRHADVIHAIAEGKKAQYLSDKGNWVDAVNINPISYFDMQWRIKPEPKPDIVKWSHIAKIDNGFEVALLSHAYSIKDASCNLKITYDGETNQPKSVELIK